MALKSATHSEDTFLMTWTVENGEHGVRLDHFLKTKYKALSRERLQGAIKEGRITLNKAVSKASRLLKPGDKVSVLSERGNEPEVDMNYQILFEDDHIIIVDKPGNLPVHPVGRFFFHTLLTQMRIVNRNEIDQNRNYFLVHRLDRETSGILIMGKQKSAAASLVDQFTTRATEKEYRAIVHGEPKEDRYVVEAHLAPDLQSGIRVKMQTVEIGPDGKPLYMGEGSVLPAKTEVIVEERLGKYSIVRCKPHTGRQHQIRVHLLHIGHPIVGDKLYGVPEDVFYQSMQGPLSLEIEPGIRLSRHALHAASLSITHPATKERLRFESKLPEELDAFLAKVRR